MNIVTADLFQKYDTLEKFAAADLKELEQDIHSIGFYHMKAKNIIACCRDDLGEIFGINYSSLSNIFSSATGQTIIEYLTFIRILHAKELLINTDKKIYEICSEIGYTEPKYFIKRFRQIVGVTPKEYRKSRAAMSSGWVRAGRWSNGTSWGRKIKTDDG